jgi:hypothetical protein
MATHDDGAVDPSYTTDLATFAAAIEAAWAEGEAGWARLARACGLASKAPSGPAGQQLALPLDAVAPPAGPSPWWEDPPWHGRIADDEFRAIVAAYVARYGAYTPDLPSREPGLLRAWLRERNNPETHPPRVAA